MFGICAAVGVFSVLVSTVAGVRILQTAGEVPMDLAVLAWGVSGFVYRGGWHRHGRMGTVALESRAGRWRTPKPSSG
jgi:hypothetical protein